MFLQKVNDVTALTINKSAIKTIVCDFDGTLAKLNIDFHHVRKRIGDLILSYGIDGCDLSANFVLEMIGDVTANLNQQSPKKANMFIDEANALIENIEIKAAECSELFADTKPLLSSLNSLGIPCGIISRNCSKAIKIIFPDILSFCPVVVCRNDVKNVKPHPEHLNLALKKLGASPGSTLMIGDLPIDIITGRNVGTLTCGVLTGRCQKNDFIEAQADMMLSTAWEVLDIIK